MILHFNSKFLSGYFHFKVRTIKIPPLGRKLVLKHLGNFSFEELVVVIIFGMKLQFPENIHMYVYRYLGRSIAVSVMVWWGMHPNGI